MRLIELHVLQSFPVSCLNRDDVGAPKSAVFGGATRARVSSQCLKRAIRELAHEYAPSAFAGQRSRLIIQPMADALVAKGIDPARAIEAAKATGDYLATFDKEKAEKDGTLQVKTLMFLSPAEIGAMADRTATALLAVPAQAAPPPAVEGERKTKKKDGGTALAEVVKKACKDAVKAVQLKDAADIAIFGRMVASDHTLTVEGAGMFSHALSTHKADNDIDFFSAVDEAKDTDDAGAGMTGTLEFTSACYYRYAALNLDLLADPDHLGALSVEERRAVVDAFVRATLLAVPGARKNSMNAYTLPAYVLGVVKDKGQPIQLVNAFEKPVWSKDGLAAKSIEALKTHHEQLKQTWGIALAPTADGKPAEFAIPDVSLEAFCKGLVAHVH
jgi:CRISPR system Cascade subunit CasC